MVFGFSSPKWNPDGKHCYVTGASAGLGLALAKILVQKGAHVSIVARNQERLDKALAELETLRVSPSQILQSQSADLFDATTSAKALEAACEAHGGVAPDAVFTCAGASKPMFFIDMTEEDLRRGMDNGYWVQAWTVYAATRMMVKQQRRGSRICMVASTLAYMSFIGWASYAPAKHALRGLADTLNSELMLYDIECQIFFPTTMYTPGFEEESKTKPALTAEIEGADEGQTPEQAAKGMYEGFVKGHAHISADFTTSLFRAGTRGATPRSNAFVDFWLDLLHFIVFLFWRPSVDKKVRKHREEHRAYLQDKGFFNDQTK